MMQTSEVLRPTGGCRRKCAVKDPAFFTLFDATVTLAFAACALEDRLEDSICSSDSAIGPSSQNSFFTVWHVSHDVTELRSGEAHHA